MSKQVTVNSGGRSLTGWYNVKKKVITVSSMLGQKSVQVKDKEPGDLAKQMLKEMLEGTKIKVF